MSRYLYRVEELRAVERSAQAGLPAGTLMARAGAAAAEAIVASSRPPRHVHVVCGPGNNGGDGFMLATELATRGLTVACTLIGAPATATDARAAQARWTAAGGRTLDRLPTAHEADLVVDALFGIGLARPLAGEFLEAAKWLDAHARCVALDVPSGLDANSGSWVGGVAGVHAAQTVTLIGDKPGLHTAAGCDAAGAVVVAPLGITAPASACVLTGADELAALAQPRRRDTHKGTYGNVAVVGGGRGMVGAALLAARAALHLGAGRVYVDVLGAPELSVDPLQPELMFRAAAQLDDLQALVVGCGLGTDAAARAACALALSRAVPLVLDADALNLVAADAALRTALAARTAPTVLTPHPLEAARLLGTGAAEVQRDRLGAARALARQSAAIVLLKGAGSVIAAADGRSAINPTGSPALATAGTGDVLAGMLGALLAQGYDAWTATLGAAWLHGRAGEYGDAGLVASAVAPRAAEALRALRAAAAATPR